MRSGPGLCTNARTTFRCREFSETRPAPVLQPQDALHIPPRPHLLREYCYLRGEDLLQAVAGSGEPSFPRIPPRPPFA